MQALSVKKLKKVYPNNLTALKEVDLEVDEGDFFGLLGPNGAGKSTTIGILCSLVNKTSGKVSIFGHDLDTELEAAKSCLGVVPQEINFNPFEKILDVVVNQAGFYGISRKIALPRAEFFLKKMRLWEKRNQAVLRLSGGMKRRLMIARALMNHPKLLILDEPTAGVDIEIRHDLWNFLTELNQQGTTIILTTHYLEEAEQLCKHIAIIDHGEIIENAETKKLINRLPVQTLVLDLEQPITSIPTIGEYTFRMLDNFTLEIELQKHQTLNNLFTELDKHNLIIASLRNKTNRLEELFVRLIRNNKEKRL